MIAAIYARKRMREEDCRFERGILAGPKAKGDEMTTIPVRCTEKGCGVVVQVDKSKHDDYDAVIGLECPRGHRFDYDKTICPKCGAEARPATYEPEQAWFGNAVPGDNPVLKPARCNSRECDWEGPKT